MAAHKCKEPEARPDTTRWLGTYGDMVTLLMAFFVMLFAVSDTNAHKFEAFISGLAVPFHNQSAALGLLSGDTVDAAVNPVELIMPMEGHDDGPQADMAGLGTEVEGAVDGMSPSERQLDEIEAQLESVLDSTTVPVSADIRDDERGLVVAISTDEVLFATGSAELSEDGRILITEIAPVLRDAPNTIVVEGHTDDQPLHRGGYTNWNLSTDRAVAVVQMLGDNLGLPYDRVAAGGYGEHRPLMPNDSPANRAKNRRVEILIVALDVDQAGPSPDLPADDPGPAFDPDALVAGGGSTPEGEAVLDFSESLPQPAHTTPLASIIGR